MKIQSAKYLVSNTDYQACPDPDKPEYAFIGRSNVGKSSLINYITGQKGLAKTSSKPGKTQTINHFLVNERWYLVDLPGYGYAKTSKQEREKFWKMIQDYSLHRPNLCSLFVLIDARHEPLDADLEFIRWCGKQEVPLALVFTKTDKQSEAKNEARRASYIQHLKEDWVELPPLFSTSSVQKKGADDILSYIEAINESLLE